MACLSGSVTLPDFPCLSVCLIPFRLDEGLVFLHRSLLLSARNHGPASFHFDHHPDLHWSPPPLSISCSCFVPLSSHGSCCTIETKTSAVLFFWLKFLSKSSCMLLPDKWPPRFQRSFHFQVLLTTVSHLFTLAVSQRVWAYRANLGSEQC